MAERNWKDLMQAQWAAGKFVCVGLDSDDDKLPAHAKLISGKYAQSYFNRTIVDATKDIVGFYKPNLAFYRGERGKKMLRETIEHIKQVAPWVPIILDAKYGDIGNTNNGYVSEAFDFFGADAVTVHPYLGLEAMKPFLDQGNKGVIVLVKTSNPGSVEFQNTRVLPNEHTFPHYCDEMYKWVAWRVANRWNYNGNVAVVVGATHPKELAIVRDIINDTPILLPGIGAQGGDLEAAVHNGRNSQGSGFIVNSSRGIIFASSNDDYRIRAAEETQKLHDAITAALNS